MNASFSRHLRNGLIASMLIALFLLPACERRREEAAIPAQTYIRPDTPPVYAPPQEHQTQQVRFTDITEQAGISFHHVTGAAGHKWMPETMGGGAAFFDYDADGHPDILLINSNHWPGEGEGKPAPTSRLFRNKGDGTFEDVTERSGLSKFVVYGMGVAIADFDGDGREDLYITALGKNLLLRNDNGIFVDITDRAGVGFSTCCGPASPWEWSTGAVWVDVDRDGHLDLFVANYVQWTPETDIWTTLDGQRKAYATPHPYQGATSVLFRNNGDGTFTDITRQAGVHNPAGKSMSVAIDDFNDDGWPDLFVTNDTQPNFLYINNQDGTFTDRALSAGVAYDENGLARAGMGVAVADLRNNARRAIAIGNFSGESVSLYTQAAAGAFVDLAGATRLANPTTTSLTFGLLFADINLDGFKDLILANGHIESEIELVREGWTFAQPAQLFLNNRQGQFVEVTQDIPDLARPLVGRALAAADIDGDGALDLLISHNGGAPRLLRNDTLGLGTPVRIRLEGKGHNRAAIGARLRAQAGGITQTRFITTGGSYLSQNELIATFGIGDADMIDVLTVRWPDGSEEQHKNLGGHSLHVIRQGEGLRSSTALRRN